LSLPPANLLVVALLWNNIRFQKRNHNHSLRHAEGSSLEIVSY
jgi:hypothetical protein